MSTSSRKLFVSFDRLLSHKETLDGVDTLRNEFRYQYSDFVPLFEDSNGVSTTDPLACCDCASICVIISLFHTISVLHLVDISKIQLGASSNLFENADVQSNDIFLTILQQVIEFQEHAYRKGFQLRALDGHISSVSETRCVLIMDYRSKIPVTKSRLGIISLCLQSFICISNSR